MSSHKLRVDMFDLVASIANIVDMMSAAVGSHHMQVAYLAYRLSEELSLSNDKRFELFIAAYLHDLGKLAIPSEILEKRDALTEDECFIMRSHVYHTYQALEPVDVLRAVSSWGSLHQERLNGTGYPFGLMADDLPLGSRIMAVADVFTALTEDRPYRKGMIPENTTAVLQVMVEADELDKNLMEWVFRNYDELNEIRDTAQKESTREYQAFQTVLQRCGKLTELKR